MQKIHVGSRAGARCGVAYSIASISFIESGQTPCQVSRDAIAVVVVAVFANAHHAEPAAEPCRVHETVTSGVVAVCSGGVGRRVLVFRRHGERARGEGQVGGGLRPSRGADIGLLEERRHVDRERVGAELLVVMQVEETLARLSTLE